MAKQFYRLNNSDVLWAMWPRVWCVQGGFLPVPHELSVQQAQPHSQGLCYPQFVIQGMWQCQGVPRQLSRKQSDVWAPCVCHQSCSSTAQWGIYWFCFPLGSSRTNLMSQFLTSSQLSSEWCPYPNCARQLKPFRNSWTRETLVILFFPILMQG